MKEINPQNIGIFGDKGRLRDDLRVNLWNHTIIINVTSSSLTYSSSFVWMRSVNEPDEVRLDGERHGVTHDISLLSYGLQVLVIHSPCLSLLFMRNGWI